MKMRIFSWSRVPSLRDGSPLPRPPLCSFLATAVDPSPNFGGGVGVGTAHLAQRTSPGSEVLPLSPRNEGGGGRGVGALRGGQNAGTCERRGRRWIPTSTHLLLTVALGLTLTAACTPGEPRPGEPEPAPGYRLVPPLSPEAQARADSALAAIQRLPADAWQAHTFRGSDGIELRYRLLPPANPEPGRRYPLVVMFHGSGEIGTDNERQLTRFVKAWARPEIRRDYPAFVLAPQMPERSANYTGAPESAERSSVPGRPLFTTLELIDRLRAELPVDASRVYALGFSMGASTTFQALALRPDLFAAAIPVAGVPDRAQAAAVARTPVWIIHGNSDDENPIGPDRAFRPVLEAVPGARVTFWEMDAGGHRVPADLLAGDAFARWLWAHTKP
jgi:predicted esterase